MSELRSSGSLMSYGAMCILARTLIWQEGPGVLISDLSLTFMWQFEAAGKGHVGRACDVLSVPQWITAAFSLDAGASAERMLEAVPAEPPAASWLRWLKAR